MAKPVATLGDMHSCPIPGHGVTPLVSGCGKTIVNGKPTVCIGDKAGCGAVIIEGTPIAISEGQLVSFKGAKSSHGGVIVNGDSSYLVDTGGASVVPIPSKAENLAKGYGGNEGKNQNYSDGNKNGINMFLYVFYKEVAKEGTLTRLTSISYPYDMIKEITQNPKKYGIIPRGDLIKKGNSIVKRPGLHALGNTNSIYTSASTIEAGAGGIDYTHKFYIDIEVAKKHGGKIISTQEIIKDLHLLKREQPHLSSRINKLLTIIDKVEAEILVEKRVPKRAIMTEKEYKLMKKMNIAGKGLFILSIGLTAIEIKNATMKSIEQKSYKPVVAETIRQTGGWGGAWAGARLGGAAGALVGVETGPGAIVSGIVGGIVFGFAGYFGADWVADYIDEN